MWRQKYPPGNRHSDEILSDDDELDQHQVTYDNDCTKNLQSLYSNQKKVQSTSPVLSQLGPFTDKERSPTFEACEVNLRQSSSSTGAWLSGYPKLENFTSDFMIGMRQVQVPSHELPRSLSTNDRHSESGEDSISDEENAVFSKLSGISGTASVQRSGSHNLQSESQDATCTWSAVIEAAHELATVLNKADSCPLASETSEARGIHAGDRPKAKLKFSFRPLLHKDNLSRYTAPNDGIGNGKSFKDATEGPPLHSKPEHETMENSVAELLGNLQERNDELSMKVASHDHRGGGTSIAELLEDLQHKDDPSIGPPNLLLQNIEAKDRKARHAMKSILPYLGSRILDDEDPPEDSGGGLSSEDEDNDQNHICVTTQKVKGHTMADLFQEAFSRSEAEDPSYRTSKQTGIGYHGRLQQVLQTEKDRQLEFLKDSQKGQSPSNNSGCMDVQILSRFLEAKLTVCQCLFGEYVNSSQFAKGRNKCAADRESRKVTILFSSKICDSVELEVGNYVRIHPPWKEVQVNGDEKIILCMYFSPLMAGGGSSSHT